MILEAAILDVKTSEAEAFESAFSETSAILRGERRLSTTLGSFRFGGRMRSLMLKAGFEKVITGASYENHGDREGAHFIVGLYDRALRDDVRPRSVQTIKEQGWADDEQLARLLEAWKAWGEDQRSFYAICRVENVGWKPRIGR